MKQVCRVCARVRVLEHLNFGPQPVRNPFLRPPDEDEFTPPLSLCYCGSCGTVQLADPPPVAEVRPRFGWLSYNEPEGHLDRSEEHTSELQSRGLISYAVFC